MIKKYIDWSSEQWLKRPYNTSWLWNDIFECGSFITNNLRWQVGNGRSISLNHPLWSLQKKRGKVDACTSAVGHKPLKWAPVSAVVCLTAETKMAVNILFFFFKQNRALQRFQPLKCTCDFIIFRKKKLNNCF